MSYTHSALSLLAPAVLAAALVGPLAGCHTANAQAERTGDFQVRRHNERWSFITPNGQNFFIRGVHGVRYIGDTVQNGLSQYEATVSQKYGNKKSWAKVAVANVRSWGFNTIGANSDSATTTQGLPFVYLLDLSAKTKMRHVDMPDVFDDEWKQSVMETARAKCAKYADNPNLIGYFTDNELHWSGDYKTKENLVQIYLTLPDSSEGHRKAQEYLEAHGLSARSMKYHDADGFQELVAKQYFQVTHDAIKAVDPDHLILGCRFSTPGLIDAVLRGTGRNVDVVSWNCYRPEAPISQIDHITELTGHPVLISEFSFLARDSGLPNTVDASPLVDTQEQRAAGTEAYMRALSQCRNCVGYIWFKYADNPPEGSASGGGENNNYGLVSNRDEPYRALTQRVKRTQSDQEPKS